MKRLGPAALAAVLLTSCGGPLLFGEVEIPDLRVTLPQQAFPAAVVVPPLTTAKTSLSTSYDIAAQVPAFSQNGVTYELRLMDVAFTLSATQTPGAPTDLGGIKSAVVRVGTDPATAALVASYYRPAVPISPPPTTLAVTGNANLDLAPYIAAGRLPVQVEVEFDGSTPAFNADIMAAFYVRVTVDWGSYL